MAEAAPDFLGQALRIAAKDLRIEWRSREVFATMTFLAVVVVLIFSFAFVVEGARPPAPVVAGILWVAVVVSGTVALSRVFDREREGEAIRSLLLAPAPRGAIYIGKLLATVCLMLVTETILTGLCVVLFATRVDMMLLRVVLLLALGTVGFAAVGCIFSAALLRARGRDALLSTLLYPIVVPILIAGARGTAQLLDLTATDIEGANFWTQFLFALDIMFVTAGLWAFGPVVGGD